MIQSRLRRWAAFATATALCAVACPTTPPAHAAAKKCSPKGAKTRARTDVIRVYRLGDAIVACVLKTGKTRRLSAGNGTYAYVYDARGSYVGYELYETVEDITSIMVRSMEVRSGRLAVDVPAFGGGANVSARPIRAVTSMSLLRTGGRVAWITPQPGMGAVSEVWYADGADARKLDEGEGIEGDSLAVGLRHVYWTRGGAAQRFVVP